MKQNAQRRRCTKMHRLNWTCKWQSVFSQEIGAGSQKLRYSGWFPGNCFPARELLLQLNSGNRRCQRLPVTRKSHGSEKGELLAVALTLDAAATVQVVKKVEWKKLLRCSHHSFPVACFMRLSSARWFHSAARCMYICDSPGAPQGAM